jgi:hypothetical protein
MPNGQLNILLEIRLGIELLTGQEIVTRIDLG